MIFFWRWLNKELELIPALMASDLLLTGGMLEVVVAIVVVELLLFPAAAELLVEVFAAAVEFV